MAQRAVFFLNIIKMKHLTKEHFYNVLKYYSVRDKYHTYPWRGFQDITLEWSYCNFHLFTDRYITCAISFKSICYAVSLENILSHTKIFMDWQYVRYIDEAMYYKIKKATSMVFVDQFYVGTLICSVAHKDPWYLYHYVNHYYSHNDLYNSLKFVIASYRPRSIWWTYPITPEELIALPKDISLLIRYYVNQLNYTVPDKRRYRLIQAIVANYWGA